MSEHLDLGHKNVAIFHAMETCLSLKSYKAAEKDSSPGDIAIGAFVNQGMPYLWDYLHLPLQILPALWTAGALSLGDP